MLHAAPSRPTVPCTKAPPHLPPSLPPVPSPPLASPPSPLVALPTDVLLHIVTHVHTGGNPHTQALALTCRRLAAVVRSFTRHGDIALPLDLSRLARRAGAAGIEVSRGEAEGKGELRLRKTRCAGDAFVLFDKCVAGTNAYWKFRIERFQGLRIEVGVATPEAFRFKTVDRQRSWSFDCFGRVCLGGERRAYGRRMRVGDVVGLLYDARARSLSFLDGGVCMGVVPLQGLGVATGHLLPYVYLPYHEGEEVRLLAGEGPVSVSAVRKTGLDWKRPSGLPYEGVIIVQTWQATVWYALEVDPERTTLREFWEMVQTRHGMDKGLFELIHEGRRLRDEEGVLLCEEGITIDKRSGASRADVLLSVPHIVS